MSRTSILKSLLVVFDTAAALASSPVLAEEGSPQRVRRQAFDWLDNNARFATDKVSEQVREGISDEIAANEDFIITLGASSMQSGRACQVHVFAGHFCFLAERFPGREGPHESRCDPLCGRKAPRTRKALAPTAPVTSAVGWMSSSKCPPGCSTVTTPELASVYGGTVGG